MAEHALIALHVWVLATRLKVDYNVRDVEFSGRRMQAELFERFWQDTVIRIRNAGVVELSVNKQLQTIIASLTEALKDKDVALAEAKQTKEALARRIRELEAALSAGAAAPAKGGNPF